MVDELLQRHDAFRHNAGDARGFLQRLASTKQSPGALYVGCSDSRVVPELLTSSAPGELFVVRNIANVVPPLEHADASVGAAIEYAVAHLHVPHLVVCGHYGCGGVEAALGGLEPLRGLPSLHDWLGGVLPGAEAARAAGLEGDALLRRAVEENVLVQLDNLVTFPPVAQALERGDLALHGWVYDMFGVELQIYDGTTDAFVPAGRLLKPT
jgi:carbonic anhydrase